MVIANTCEKNPYGFIDDQSGSCYITCVNIGRKLCLMYCLIYNGRKHWLLLRCAINIKRWHDLKTLCVFNIIPPTHPGAGEVAVTVVGPDGQPVNAEVLASGRVTRLALPPAQAAGVESSAWTVAELVERCGE